jgi:hypothetical protein
MNPAVIVRDAAASVLLVVVEVGRQDHRLGLRLWLGASHATRVAALSSVPLPLLPGRRDAADLHVGFAGMIRKFHVCACL